MTAQVYEKGVSDYVTKLMYASMQDIDTARAEAGADIDIDPMAVQTYGNLCKAATDRLTVKPRFTFAVDVKQHLAVIMGRYITEIAALQFQQAHRLGDVLSALSTDPDHIAQYIIKIGATPDTVGPTLSAARDEKNWLSQKLSGEIRSKNASLSDIALAELAGAFDSFLRVIVRAISVVLHYSSAVMSSGIFVATLIQHGVPIVLTEDVRGNVRPKKARPPKKAETAAAVVEVATVATPIDPDLAALLAMTQ